MVEDLSDTFFYHVTELPGYGVIDHPTSWDVRGRFRDYIGVDITGKSFLDVGAGSGYNSFEAEKHGAREVISFDAAHPGQLQIVPYANIPDDAPTSVFPKMRRAYWLAHRLLGSQAKVVYGDVYKLSQEVPPCDVVLIGQILVHLRTRSRF